MDTTGRSRAAAADGPIGRVRQFAAAPSERVGLVFYDADCQLCVHSASRFEAVLAKRNFRLLPLQTHGAAAQLQVREERLLDEMRVLLPDGRVFGGADAVVEIARRIWWAWPLVVLSRLPGVMPLLRSFYRWIARHRACAGRACAIETPASLGPLAFLPLLILPVLALLVASRMPRWGFMWTMAFALYAGCKWLTYREARTRGAMPSRIRALGYLLAWPGMDALGFFTDAARLPRPRTSEWAVAALKTLFGITLLVVAIRNQVNPLLTGWIGMIGAIFVLHFGAFHLLSLAWRGAGVKAVPLMQSPFRSTSLAELWGRRWNTAFHELVKRYTFRPLQAKVGNTAAMLLVFLVSGLVHDLVISVPARGGYGLPTGYFLLQSLGIAAERARLGRRVGLGRGWRGWLFTFIVAVGPMFWLFHPPFVRNIILPMLAAMGGIGGLHMNLNLTHLLQTAGVLHLGLMCAGLLMPRVVGMRQHLAGLPPFIRRLFWVYYSFIALCLVSFSVITIVFADTLAAGGPLARALCAFFALFWTLRLIAGTFVFDMRPYLTNGYRRVGYSAINIVFIYLPVIYALAASRPRWIR